MDYSVSQNITSNTSTISMTLYIYDGTGYSQNEYSGEAYYIIQGEKRWSPYYYGSTGWYTLGSKSITIKHNADGTGRVTLSGEWDCGFASNYTPRHLTVSGTVELPRIPQVSSMKYGRFTIGKPGTITIQRADPTFYDTIYYRFGNASSVILTKTDKTSISWTPPLSMAGEIPNATSGAGKFEIITYRNGVEIGREETSFIADAPLDAAPSITAAISQQEQIAALGIYVQNQSRLQVELTGLAKYGATIKSYAASVDGTGKSQQSFTADLPQAGQIKVTYRCKDSRGLSANGSQTITVIPWLPPSVTAIKAARCTAKGVADPLGDHAKVTFSAKISPLANKNTAAYTLKYRPVGGTSWQSLPISTAAGNYAPSGASIIIPVDTGTAYDICVEAEDRFKRQDSLPVLLGSAGVFNRIDAKNNAITCGEYRTKKDTFFIGGKMALETLNPARLAGGIESIGGLPFADFPIEQGETNGWIWRKWASGRAECYKVVRKKNIVIENDYGAVFRSAEISGESLPFTFINKVYDTVDIADAALTAWAVTFSGATENVTQTIYLLSTTSKTIPWIDLLYKVEGRWM